jgi:hypothetical protein
LSGFGGDAEGGAIRAAIYERHAFTVRFPSGMSKTVQLGPDANCYNGSVLLGPKQSIRHLIGVSTALHANGSTGMTYLVHLDGETINRRRLSRGQAYTALAAAYSRQDPGGGRGGKAGRTKFRHSPRLAV